MRRKEKYYYSNRSLEDKITDSLSLNLSGYVTSTEKESKPRLIAFLKRRYGEVLIGEIIETKSDSRYVVRKIVKEGLKASPLGEYRSDRPHIVTLPNDANGRVADKKKIASRHRENYRNILLEIKKEGGNVEIPSENNNLFDLS